MPIKAKFTLYVETWTLLCRIIESVPMHLANVRYVLTQRRHKPPQRLTLQRSARIGKLFTAHSTYIADANAFGIMTQAMSAYLRHRPAPLDSTIYSNQEVVANIPPMVMLNVILPDVVHIKQRIR